MKIFICSDSRGFLTPDKTLNKAWTTLIRDQLIKEQHQVEIAAWSYTVYTYDRMLRSLKTGIKPDLVISQLGQSEMCIGPKVHKMTWIKEIPLHYNVQLRQFAPDCYNYDTLVDCQQWLIDILKEIDANYLHLAIMPTRTSAGSPDFDRLNEFRKMLSETCKWSLPLKLDTTPNVTYDGEHYTFEMHEYVYSCVMDQLKSKNLIGKYNDDIQKNC